MPHVRIWVRAAAVHTIVLSSKIHRVQDIKTMTMAPHLPGRTGKG